MLPFLECPLTGTGVDPFPTLGAPFVWPFTLLPSCKRSDGAGGPRDQADEVADGVGVVAMGGCGVDILLIEWYDVRSIYGWASARWLRSIYH